MIDINKRYKLNRESLQLEVSLFNGNKYKTKLKESELNRIEQIVENILYYNANTYKILGK